jgi:hypothetical protein
MALATLLNLNVDDPRAFATFFFEEAMSHRTQLGAMNPLDRFSALPYFIDPPMITNGMWKLDHQSAQSDANSTIPTWGSPDPNYPGTLHVSVPETRSIIDVNFSDQRERTFWVFWNHHDQFVAQGFLPAHLTPAW